MLLGHGCAPKSSEILKYMLCKNVMRDVLHQQLLVGIRVKDTL